MSMEMNPSADYVIDRLRRNIDDLEEECEDLAEKLDKYSSHIMLLEDSIEVLLKHIDEGWSQSPEGVAEIKKVLSLTGKGVR